MTQDEILAAKAAALATAKSELETAAGFRAPLAPGSRPPQLRRTESTASSLLAGPAQGSTPAGPGTWPSPAAPTDGPVAADFYPGGQPAYTQSRPAHTGQRGGRSLRAEARGRNSLVLVSVFFPHKRVGVFSFPPGSANRQVKLGRYRVGRSLARQNAFLCPGRV